MANGLLNYLVAYYKFDEGTSASNAQDAHTGAHHMTRTGSPTVGTGLLGGFRHTLSGARFSSPDLAFGFGDQDVTFVGFFRPTAISALQSIMSRTDTNAMRSYAIRLSTTTMMFVLSNDGTNAISFPFTGLTITANTWYFVCARYNPTTDLAEFSVTPVLEGVLRPFQSTTWAKGFYAGGTAVFTFGSEYTSGSPTSPATVDLDEWGIYAAGLTDTQVAQFFGNGTPLGYQNFDTGSVAQTLAGTSAGVSANSALLGVGKPLDGVTSGVSANSTAPLTVGKVLAGTTLGASGNTGAVTTGKPLIGLSSGVVVPLGTLALAKPLDGVTTGISTSIAALKVVTPVFVNLAGITSGKNTPAGNLQVVRGPIQMTAASAGVSGASGSLSVRRVAVPSGPTAPAGGVVGTRSATAGRKAFEKMSKATVILPPPRWPELPKEIAQKFPSLAKSVAEYDEKTKDFFRQMQQSQE